MKKFLLAQMIVTFALFFTGCGESGSGQPPDYVGVFKSVRTSSDTPGSGNDKIIIVTITKDDGILYEGTIDKLPVKGTWGKSETDALGLISNQLNKGYDKYFIDFFYSIGGSGVSGTAYRQ